MFILTSILIAGITIIKSDHNVNFEPGHIKQDFESIEEVRGHENETTTGWKKLSLKKQMILRLCCLFLLTLCLNYNRHSPKIYLL